MALRLNLLMERACGFKTANGIALMAPQSNMPMDHVIGIKTMCFTGIVALPLRTQMELATGITTGT